MRYHNYTYQVYDVKNFKAPDWRSYKVDDYPELVRVRNALASHGLKDPWLRNECWRFNPAFGETHRNVLRTVFRGWKLGLVAAVSLYFVNNVIFPEEPHHGDHH
ncbi:hypothetical protein HAZT_HAZT008023 [Hyalella azteca]|nr:hypothetical protein HAZT_HAZT008023 [Hyalella azteca]